MSQKADIIEYLREHGSLTRWEAFTYLGIAELSSRIGELTKEGFEIPRKSIEVTARNGRVAKVMQYQTPTAWA
jgi:hypothetical protein